MNDDIKYIEKNYIEEKELCEISKISSQALGDLIRKELIPDASYIVNSTKEISSPLGDSVVHKDIKKYFSKNIIALLEKNKTSDNVSEFKKNFKNKFRLTLENSLDKKYAYNNILDDNGKINENKLDIVFEEEWKYYSQGIYGICTINASEFDILHKEVTVKKLIEFNEKHKSFKLNKEEKETLKVLNEEFNKVSSLFAPYQRENSSRGKYLDKILNLNSLNELVKKYR